MGQTIADDLVVNFKTQIDNLRARLLSNYESVESSPYADVYQDLCKLVEVLKKIETPEVSDGVVGQ